ncbi:sigma 54-interacting transcriptional regulator [Desulfococcus sp.]|uniref:sigma 54-interacting transcriptional regulator n=1 Tax=Desulfococcus sp. TaxID=2025834 RepID=UPI003594206D
MSQVVEVDHPFQTPENPNQRIHSHVIYFGTPCFSENGERRGYLLLSLDVRAIRNILSLFNSPQSPIQAFSRTPALRYAYLFDPDGWILFQNESVEKKDLELTTDLARSTYDDGILGKPGLPSAFRPSFDFRDFWKMVGDVKKGRHDLIHMENAAGAGVFDKDASLAYAPVLFEGDLVAGIAYVDRTQFTRMAGYKHLDIMLFITILTIAVVSLIIFILARMITKPIYQLAGAVNHIQKSAQLHPIRIPSRDYEVNLLVNAINRMIAVMNAQMADIREKEIKIKTVENKERIALETEFPRQARPDKAPDLPEIIGFGARIEQLRSDIFKAAGSDADVLIIGETGTGKQLAAEAIHRHGGRSARPFISVNCGELGETLLLDSLFGHVKGAYTEAKTDRKGAFLEAHGGTLFLDEIQNASLTVQQALLRAVSIRKVRPVGSDKELDVDVRLICATNADLTLLIERQMFRADLYFRLKVITIHPPPLRDQKQNIPVLVNHLLLILEASTRRTGIGISRGALEKLKQYHWPGNIRELNNCITRAVVMSESRIIQEDDIILEKSMRTQPDSGDTPGGNEPEMEAPMLPGQDPPVLPVRSEPGRTDPAGLPFRINRRQEKVYPYILSRKTITRSDYMKWVGTDISPRTAVYDLQDLVKKGVLRKDGSGPATRYILVEQ